MSLLKRVGASRIVAGLTLTGTSLYLYNSHVQRKAEVPYIDAEQLYYNPHSIKAGRLALESDIQSQSRIGRPSATWTPPTRSEMLEALFHSSASNVKPVSWFTQIYSTIYPEVEPEPLRTSDNPYDLLVIGGGATGAGVALDAASRGLKVALVERDDFSAGTSSKSTKLVHGGVRYLQKAVFELDYEQYKLVREALHERRTFLHTAPYLSHPLPIMLPIYKWYQVPYFYAGCKMYDILAGKANMESSYVLGAGKALQNFPMLKKEGLAGAVVYYDGQHNDSRMNMALINTAVQYGATVANHTEVTTLLKEENGAIKGARVKDVLTGKEFDVKARGVINATGPFADGIRKLDEGIATQEIVAPSSGVHITLPNYFAPKNMGLIDPSTSDGRVIFFLPWQGNTIAGTTDAPHPVTANPIPREEEISWILEEVRNYLNPEIRVRRGDVLSAWSGLRPLVKDPKAKNTESLVRNHLIDVSTSGMITIAGGKWTTYRAMAEETVDKAVEVFKLHNLVKGPSQTKEIQLLGSKGWSNLMFIKLIQQFGLETEVAKHLTDTYGDLSWGVCSLAEPTGLRWPVHGTKLDVAYPYIDAEVKWACRREWACTAVDVIARRTRLSFLNAEAALEALPRVIEIMGSELGWDSKRRAKEWEDGKTFLESMGLNKASIQNLTIDDVKKYKHRLKLDTEAEFLQRNLFSSEELVELKKKFQDMDVDQDGRISERDLRRTMKEIGFVDVPKDTVKRIIREVDANNSGQIEFREFLDIAGGVKEVSRSSAFSDIVAKVAGVKSLEYGKATPLEKSGGGI